MVVANNEMNKTKSTRQTLVILITMWMWWCDVGCIAQWRTSRSSLEATGCHQWASAHATLPWRPPWSTNLLKQHKTLTNHNFRQQLHGTNYSIIYPVTFGTQNRPSTQHIKATSCVKMWDAIIRVEELTDISSYQSLLVTRGQKFKKLLTLNEAHQKSWLIYEQIAIKLLRGMLFLETIVSFHASTAYEGGDTKYVFDNEVGAILDWSTASTTAICNC